MAQIVSFSCIPRYFRYMFENGVKPNGSLFYPELFCHILGDLDS